MFERYTEGARRLVFFGRNEALKHEAPEIDPEHLLLGFFKEEGALLESLAPALTRESVEAVTKRGGKRHVSHTFVERLLTRWFGSRVSVDLPLSNSSKRVLAYATEEAQRANSMPIVPAHLFLGIIREGPTPAAKVLSDAGVDLKEVRLRLKDGIPTALNPSQAPTTAQQGSQADALYCANCKSEVTDPLTCGDCSAVICRACGTPLEAAGDLGFGD